MNAARDDYNGIVLTSYALCRGVGTPYICIETPEYISTTLLESTEVSSVPAEVVDSKSSVEEFSVAVYPSCCCVGTLCNCSKTPVNISTHDLDRVVDVHAALPLQGLTIQTVQRTVKCPQSQRVERVVHVPVARQRRGPSIQPVQACFSERGARMMIPSCDEPLSSSGPPQSATFLDERHSSAQVFT